MTKFYNNKNHKKIQKPNSLRLHFETLFELFYAAAIQKSRKFQKFVENSSILWNAQIKINFENMQHLVVDSR